METVYSTDGVEKDEISDCDSSFGSFRSSTSTSVSEYRWRPSQEIEEIDEGWTVFSRTSSSRTSVSSFSTTQPQTRRNWKNWLFGPSDVKGKPTSIERRRKQRQTEKRKLKVDPRLSNPPNNLYGEQSAAGWPAWLSAVAGEAINGMVPRKVDTFEKISMIGQGTYSNPPNKLKVDPRLSNPPNNLYGEQSAAGWPAWLSAVAGEAINGMIPRKVDTFEKISMIGQGTYSNVYKARDVLTGKIVALKMVRFDNLEPESVKFMAREILILRRLDHPNVVKLEGLALSRVTCHLYLVFEYMEHDLAGLAASPLIKFSEPHVKCYMHQLLSGLEHCHNNGVLHRDVKGSNLLLDNAGILKIADFGLAAFFNPENKQPMTSRVGTLWYRPPELLLGATDYGVGVDLWSAGCILAELLAGKPIMPRRTEVEQVHEIFKHCGSPSDDFWKKYKLPHASIFRPQQPYKRCIMNMFKHFPSSSLPLIDTLLSIDPAERQTAFAALQSEFFTIKPYASDPSSLPQYPPTKEMDAKLRDEEARRLRAAGNKANECKAKKSRTRDRSSRALPAPEANAELQAILDKRRPMKYRYDSDMEIRQYF